MSKVLDLIYKAGPDFYQILISLGSGENGTEKNEVLDIIEELVASEATKNGTNVVMVPSDTAMRAFLKEIGMKSVDEMLWLPSRREFVLSHVGTVKSNLGRGKGQALGAVVGGVFKSKQDPRTGLDVGFKVKTKSKQSCDELTGIIRWVVSRKHDVNHIGSANRFDTKFAGPEYDQYQNDEGRLDCADFYRIPGTLQNNETRLRLLNENRPSTVSQFAKFNK